MNVPLNSVYRWQSSVSSHSNKAFFHRGGNRLISCQFISKEIKRCLETINRYHFCRCLGRCWRRLCMISCYLLYHVPPVLSSAQHGFLPRRSCVTNLATYLEHAWTSMSDGCQTDAVYTDFSAAFQPVNHDLLLHKLSKSYHFSGKTLDWFTSYLSGREQIVVVNGKSSDWL